jgi:hypothetical protein
MSEAPKHYLSKRGNWQLAAQQGGALAEKDTAGAIQTYLDNTYPGEWKVERKPQDLRQIYFEYTYERNPERYAKPEHPTEDDVWYCPILRQFRTLKKDKATGGGCEIDCKIENLRTGRRIFLEVKNQGPAGNAQERAAKYATPSVIAHVQKKFGVSYHPFGYVFTGEMVERLDYRVELETTYGFAADHMLLWRKERPLAPLVDWLETVILPPLKPSS